MPLDHLWSCATLLTLHIILLLVVIGYFIYNKSQRQVLSQFSAILLTSTGLIMAASIGFTSYQMHIIRAAKGAEEEPSKKKEFEQWENAITYDFMKDQIIANCLLALLVCGYSMNERGKLTLVAITSVIALASIAICSYAIHTSPFPGRALINAASGAGQ